MTAFSTLLSCNISTPRSTRPFTPLLVLLSHSSSSPPSLVSVFLQCSSAILVHLVHTVASLTKQLLKIDTPSAPQPLAFILPLLPPSFSLHLLSLYFICPSTNICNGWWPFRDSQAEPVNGLFRSPTLRVAGCCSNNNNSSDGSGSSCQFNATNCHVARPFLLQQTVAATTTVCNPNSPLLPTLPSLPPALPFLSLSLWQ